MTEAGKANSSAASLKRGLLAELAENNTHRRLPRPIRIAPEPPEDTSFASFDEEEVTEQQL